MTVYVQLIALGMSAFRFLRVPHDGGPATLVDYESHETTAALVERGIPARRLADPIGPLDRAAVDEMLSFQSSLLWRLHRDRFGCRVGWSECRGLDGEVADFYALRQ